MSGNDGDPEPQYDLSPLGYLVSLPITPIILPKCPLPSPLSDIGTAEDPEPLGLYYNRVFALMESWWKMNGLWHYGNTENMRIVVKALMSGEAAKITEEQWNDCQHSLKQNFDRRSFSHVVVMPRQLDEMALVGDIETGSGMLWPDDWVDTLGNLIGPPQNFQKNDTYSKQINMCACPTEAAPPFYLEIRRVSILETPVNANGTLPDDELVGDRSTGSSSDKVKGREIDRQRDDKTNPKEIPPKAPEKYAYFVANIDTSRDMFINNTKVGVDEVAGPLGDFSIIQINDARGPRIRHGGPTKNMCVKHQIVLFWWGENGTDYLPTAETMAENKVSVDNKETSGGRFKNLIPFYNVHVPETLTPEGLAALITELETALAIYDEARRKESNQDVTKAVEARILEAEISGRLYNLATKVSEQLRDNPYMPPPTISWAMIPDWVLNLIWEISTDALGELSSRLGSENPSKVYHDNFTAPLRGDKSAALGEIRVYKRVEKFLELYSKTLSSREKARVHSSFLGDLRTIARQLKAPPGLESALDERGKQLLASLLCGTEDQDGLCAWAANITYLVKKFTSPRPMLTGNNSAAGNGEGSSSGGIAGGEAAGSLADRLRATGELHWSWVLSNWEDTEWYASIMAANVPKPEKIEEKPEETPEEKPEEKPEEEPEEKPEKKINVWLKQRPGLAPTFMTAADLAELREVLYDVMSGTNADPESGTLKDAMAVEAKRLMSRVLVDAKPGKVDWRVIGEPLLERIKAVSDSAQLEFTRREDFDLGRVLDVPPSPSSSSHSSSHFSQRSTNQDRRILASSEVATLTVELQRLLTEPLPSGSWVNDSRAAMNQLEQYPSPEEHIWWGALTDVLLKKLIRLPGVKKELEARKLDLQEPLYEGPFTEYQLAELKTATDVAILQTGQINDEELHGRARELQARLVFRAPQNNKLSWGDIDDETLDFISISSHSNFIRLEATRRKSEKDKKAIFEARDLQIDVIEGFVSRLVESQIAQLETAPPDPRRFGRRGNGLTSAERMRDRIRAKRETANKFVEKLKIWAACVPTIDDAQNLTAAETKLYNKITDVRGQEQHDRIVLRWAARIAHRQQQWQRQFILRDGRELWTFEDPELLAFGLNNKEAVEQWARRQMEQSEQNRGLLEQYQKDFIAGRRVLYPAHAILIADIPVQDLLTIKSKLERFHTDPMANVTEVADEILKFVFRRIHSYTGIPVTASEINQFEDLVVRILEVDKTDIYTQKRERLKTANRLWDIAVARHRDRVTPEMEAFKYQLNKHPADARGVYWRYRATYDQLVEWSEMDKDAAQELARRDKNHVRPHLKTDKEYEAKRARAAELTEGLILKSHVIWAEEQEDTRKQTLGSLLPRFYRELLRVFNDIASADSSTSFLSPFNQQEEQVVRDIFHQSIDELFPRGPYIVHQTYPHPQLLYAAVNATAFERLKAKARTLMQGTDQYGMPDVPEPISYTGEAPRLDWATFSLKELEVFKENYPVDIQSELDRRENADNQETS